MTKLYNVILSDSNGKESNIIVKDEHLDDYLYHAGFAVKDCYYIGCLYELKEQSDKSYDEYSKRWEIGLDLARD